MDGSRKRWVGQIPFSGKWENASDVFGFYQKPNGGFTGFVTDGERGLVSHRFPGDSEQEVEHKLLDFVQRDLYINTRQAVLSDKENYKAIIIRYLEEICGYGRERACREAGEFLQDSDVFFEMAYFAETGQFVPDRYAYQVCGHSAQNLSEDTILAPVGAFHYLLYLKRDAKGALSNLEKGLPRK